ncbi:MAG TPA: response regulator, partial [Puia sp.]|nr:response regulator [Puia sp.]
MNILLVEDEPKVAEFIRKGLREQSYQVDTAYDSLYGEKLALENEYDLAILDVILPGGSGLELCKRIRDLKPEIPILLLTAMGATRDKVTGLEAGADDYLVKPFHFEELLARIKALGRRKLLVPPGIVYRVSDL